MDKCVFCGWYRRTNDPSLKFFSIPREPGLKRVKWLYAIGDREISPKDRVCGIHFRQGRPSNDPSHEDFAPHLFLQRVVTHPVAKTLTYLESFASDDDLEGPSTTSTSRTERPLEPLRACKPSILRKRRKVDSTEDTNAADTESNDAQEEKLKEDDLSNVVVMTNPVNGIQRRMKMQHLPRAFVEAVGIKPGQTVIIKRRIRVAKAVRTRTEESDTMGNVLEKEENLLENATTSN